MLIIINYLLVFQKSQVRRLDSLEKSLLEQQRTVIFVNRKIWRALDSELSQELAILPVFAARAAAAGLSAAAAAAGSPPAAAAAMCADR